MCQQRDAGSARRAAQGESHVGPVFANSKGLFEDFRGISGSAGRAPALSVDGAHNTRHLAKSNRATPPFFALSRSHNGQKLAN